jgi:predicted metal-dependent phosphoesterase TrpH
LNTLLNLKLDLHTHSSYSDGLGDPQDLLECARKKGLDGLAITDHNTLEGYFKAKEYAGNLLLVPGYEVETEAGHILVLGLEMLPPNVENIRYNELIQWVRSHEGLTVLAHPAISRLHMDKWMRSPPDAVEVLNASYPLDYFVKRGLKISERVGVAAVGGSDAHSTLAVGNAYTVVEAPNANVVDIVRAIKNGHVQFEGGLSPISSRIRVGIRYLTSALSMR